MFDLSDIYIKEKAIKRENSCPSPSRVLNCWIYIAVERGGHGAVKI